MRSLLRVLAVTAVSAGLLVPAGPARADHCEPANSIYVFSSYRVVVDDETSVRNPTYALEALGCDPDLQDASLDTNYIYPGANNLSVRWFGEPDGVNFEDFGLTQLNGTLNGLGFTDFQITLHREPGIGGLGFNWDSEDIPLDPTQTGSLDVEVEVPVGADDNGLIFGTETDTYRTVDQTSPDDGHLP